MLKAVIMTAGLLALAGNAYGGDFKPVAHGSYLIDLDTMDDNFSVWRLDDLDGINAARAHISLPRCGKSKRYACSARISLSGGDKRVSLVVMAFKPNPSSSAPLYVGIDDGVDAHDQMFLTLPKFSETFDVRLHWSPEGKINFDLYDVANKDIGQGFEHHEYDLGVPVDSLEISGSTSEVTIDKLELGAE